MTPIAAHMGAVTMNFEVKAANHTRTYTAKKVRSSVSKAAAPHVVPSSPVLPEEQLASSVFPHSGSCTDQVSSMLCLSPCVLVEKGPQKGGRMREGGESHWRVSNAKAGPGRHIKQSQ